MINIKKLKGTLQDTIKLNIGQQYRKFIYTLMLIFYYE